MRSLLLLSVILGLTADVHAGEITSEYTKIDIDKDCVFHKSSDMGGAAICSGFGEYVVHFAEGDLRQMVEFGFVGDQDRGWVSFGEWNQIGKTIEWRLNDGRPFATILRWFIENIDNRTGTSNKRVKGQVLVISKVGQPNEFEACVVGYVDARANSDANTIARNVTDTVGPQFRCGFDLPRFYGKRGRYSGQPTAID